jgi:hypothetical protein
MFFDTLKSPSKFHENISMKKTNLIITVHKIFYFRATKKHTNLKSTEPTTATVTTILTGVSR